MDLRVPFRERAGKELVKGQVEIQEHIICTATKLVGDFVNTRILSPSSKKIFVPVIEFLIVERIWTIAVLNWIGGNI